jgi:ABC-2 type transport system permease protein
MNKILVVAKSEFLTAVRSEGFIVGVLLMPVLTGFSILITAFSEKHVDVADRYFAVVDQTGDLYPVLAAKANERNLEIEGAAAGTSPQAKFIPTRHAIETRPSEEVRLELSEKIRRGDLFAFVELPQNLLGSEGPASQKIVYYSDKPTYDDLRIWIGAVINEEMLKRRLGAAGLTESDYRQLSAKVDSEHRGLASRTETGEIQSATEVDKVKTFLVPLALMFALFLVVMSATPQLLNGVLEEKMLRVSELILGSVTPFELMLGKLLATTGVSCVLATLYLTGGFIVTANAGHADAVPAHLFLFFVLFMVLAVLIFGSIFLAIGAACSELKDAQGLMTPAMLILLLPMFLWHPVLKHPDSTLAVVASLFPPSTPMLMLMRLSSHPAPPVWQVVLSIVLTTASTIACVWAAGKIFRIGILSQGKTPSIRELFRWVTHP